MAGIPPSMTTGADVDLPEAEPADTGWGGPTRPRRRRGRVTLVIVAVLLVPVLVLGIGVGWFFWEVNGHGSPGAVVPVTVDPGWGVPRIATELQKQHIVGSAFAFNVYARLNGDNKFQAGTYELHTNLGVKDAVHALRRGPKIDYVKLSVPPGLWIKEIAARVGKLPNRDAQTFLAGTRNNAVRSPYEPADVANLEGLLRPDTYQVSASQDELGILQAMVTEFDKNAQKLGLAPATTVNGYGAYDIVKVASLIESEAKVPQDRPLIASVIYNRLARNMPLQIDSTLIYARGDPDDRHLSADDPQDIKSPYNTYLHTGLPPTPIGGVSDASLEAAMHPAQTDYLYYVIAGKDGHHAFSSTYAGQQQNIAAAKALGLL